MFDLSPLTANPDIEIDFVEPKDGILPASALADHDALILLFPRFERESVPANHRLALIAKVGVGYDNVDVAEIGDQDVQGIAVHIAAHISAAAAGDAAPRCARFRRMVQTSRRSRALMRASMAKD